MSAIVQRQVTTLSTSTPDTKVRYLRKQKVSERTAVNTSGVFGWWHEKL